MINRLSLLSLALGLSCALTACNKAEKPAAAPATETATMTETATPSAAETATPAASTVDLSAEVAQYRKWVEGQIDELLAGTEKFVAALKAGNIEEAKKLYPVVRMHYERSEPIAESFGDLDPRIDNREADLQPGEKWTGFHAIEKILWVKNTTKGTEEFADQLLADIKELRAKLPNAEVTGELMVEGSVDLLNEVSTSKITGEEDIFSKTDLYDFKANIEGAEKIFMILKSKLQEKDAALVKTLEERFAEVNGLLDKYKDGTGYVPYTKLTADDTKALGDAVNRLAEPLAQMGIIYESK